MSTVPVVCDARHRRPAGVANSTIWRRDLGVTWQRRPPGARPARPLPSLTHCPARLPPLLAARPSPPSAQRRVAVRIVDVAIRRHAAVYFPQLFPAGSALRPSWQPCALPLTCRAVPPCTPPPPFPHPPPFYTDGQLGRMATAVWSP